MIKDNLVFGNMVYCFGKFILLERFLLFVLFLFVLDFVFIRSIGVILVKSCDEEDKKNWLVFLFNIVRVIFKLLDCFLISLENLRI